MDEDALDTAASQQYQHQQHYQLSTESSQDDTSPSNNESSTRGSFGHGIGISPLKNIVITKNESLSAADMNNGIYIASDAIISTSPTSFTLPDEILTYLPASPSLSIIPTQPPTNMEDDNDEHINTLQSQKARHYSNSYSDFSLLYGSPITQPIPTMNLPSSPPLPSTPLTSSQQSYPGLSSTPLTTSLPLLRNFASSYLNTASQSPLSTSALSDSLPRLSIPKLSTLMFEGSPSQRPLSDLGRLALTQSTPLPTPLLNSPSTPLPSLYSSAAALYRPPFSPVIPSAQQPLLPPEYHPLSSSDHQPSSPSSASTSFTSAQSPVVSPKLPASSLRRSGVLNTSTASYFNPTTDRNSNSVKYILSPIAPKSAAPEQSEGNQGEDQELATEGGKNERSPLAASNPIPNDSLTSSGGIVVDNMPKDVDPEIERKNIIFEILSTEESYVTFLRLIKMIYIWPLRDRIQENDPVLSELEITDLFANSENLLQQYITFLKQLRRRLRNYTPGVGIGDIFSEVGPYFKMYSTFVRCYFVRGIKLLRELNASNKKFKAFVLDAKAKCKRLDLSDLLLMPVQSLIKKTPEDHADFLLLRNALVLIKKVADQVNLGTVDDSESLAILLRIQDALGINAPKDLVQPHRKLVRQATLPLMVDDGEQTMHTNVYLFNDLFLIVEDRTSNLLECIEISRIFTRKALHVAGFSWGFEIFTASWTRTFGLSTKEEEEEWVEIIAKSTEVLTKLHPLHNAFRLQAMKDIHASRKMSVGERAGLFEHIATAHKNRNNPLPALAHFNPVAAIDAPLSAHMMVERMRLQQEEMMRENQFLFQKVESHPRMRSDSMGNFFKRFSQAQPLSQVRLPKQNQVVKTGYLTKQGGLIKNWKRRWFIMGNGHLYYTPDHMSNEVLGQIPLKGTVLEVDHENTIRPYCMILHTFSRTYPPSLRDGEKGLDEWMVSISTYFMSIATFQKLNHVVGRVIPDLPPAFKM